jgi:arylsulfatase A-like enzyme
MFVFIVAIALVFLGGAASAAFGQVAMPHTPRPPNIVLIYADDLGWEDLGCYGARGHRTPHLDRLARQGTRFTDFYVSQPVCSASRASLLTGCYANRIGIHGALGPRSPTGLSAQETTLAEIVKPRGYRTGIVGKWHLGDAPEFLPTRHGFDEYFGLPYSNDMWPHHPTAKPGSYPPLPLIEGERVIEEMPDQTQLTRRYTERAVDFIERHRGEPFFLYVAHAMPHVPLHASSRFAGRTSRGLYGDVIAELDWSVGRIADALRRFGLERDTWVIFTSDNGPWLSYGDHAGSAGPLREGKGTVFEGGVRVPCIMRWPGRIPAARVCTEPWMTIDLLPTVARLVGAQAPEQGIDGKDVWNLLSGAPVVASVPRTYLFYYQTGALQALRCGDWKLVLPHTARVLRGRAGGHGGTPVPYAEERVATQLYNLVWDRGETTDLARAHPRELERLLALAERARSELGDSLAGRVGSGVREPGRLERSRD